jgi:hypothetical protein
VLLSVVEFSCPRVQVLTCFFSLAIFGFFVWDFAQYALHVVLRGPTSISTFASGARDEEASLPGPCARFGSRVDRSMGFSARTVAIRGCSCLVRFAGGVLLPSCVCHLGSCRESPVLFLASLTKPWSASCLPPGGASSCFWS